MSRVNDSKTIEKKFYNCKYCQYKSLRHFNVLRHEERIHSNKLKRSCCGKIFHSKGEWYLHCEVKHPTMRANSFISKTKYKIIGEECCEGSNKNNSVMRRSERISKLTKKVLIMDDNDDYDGDYYDDEDDDDYDYDGYESPISRRNSENSYTDVSTDDCNNNFMFNTECIAIKTETIELMNANHVITSNIDSDGLDENSLTTKSTCNFTFSIKRTRTCSTPYCLPLKKRILQEFNDNSMTTNFLPRPKIKLTNGNQIFNWNDVTQYQRDYLSAIDFELFK